MHSKDIVENSVSKLGSPKCWNLFAAVTKMRAVIKLITYFNLANFDFCHIET